jgi:hypothetical protein
MANKTKKTLKEMYTEILENYPLSQEHKDFLNDRIEKLAKKSSGNKDNEKAEANQVLAEAIYAYMDKDKKYLISDLMKEVPELQEIDPLSNQRVTHLVGLLVKDGRVVKTKEKGRTYHQAIEVEVEAEA